MTVTHTTPSHSSLHARTVRTVIKYLEVVPHTTMRPSADSPALQNTEEPSPLHTHTHTHTHTQGLEKVEECYMKIMSIIASEDTDNDIDARKRG